MSKLRKGFALMDPEKRKEIARKAGKQAHKLHVAHEFTSEEAKKAARRSVESRAEKRAKKTAKN